MKTKIFDFEISDKLLDAIETVESNGNNEAIGDDGKALGSFQIHKIFVDDVNRILGKTQYDYDDRKDKIKSREMVKIYLQHYGTSYERNQNKSASDEILSRIHNGGPKGYMKEATISYWNKVKNVMENTK